MAPKKQHLERCFFEFLAADVRPVYSCLYHPTDRNVHQQVIANNELRVSVALSFFLLKKENKNVINVVPCC